MAREGIARKNRAHTATKKGPDPHSITSKKRATRGFKSLETSSRMHKRALRRMHEHCVIEGKHYEPGTKAGNDNEFTAGGSLKYH